jgi:hypothetical protein
MGRNRTSRNKFAIISMGIIGLFVLALTACNTNSDAISVLQAENTSLHATLAAYQNIGPTVTAQATANGLKLATAQADLGTARAQNRELITRLNGGSANSSMTMQQTGSSGAMDTTAGGASAGNNNPQVAPTPAPADPNAFAIAGVTTTKKTDADGCATTSSNQFSTTDAEIWVVADVRNYKRGTSFTAKWSGNDFSHENSWTINSSGAQICVHFYIEPGTLEMAAGTYTVTLSADGAAPQSVTFTVQGEAQGGDSQVAATP